MRETGRNPVKSSVDFLLTCLHKSLVDFRLPPATNLKLKAFEGRAVVIRLICEQHRKLYGHTGFTRGHGTTVGLERRRSGGARPPDAARLQRTAPAGAKLYAPRASRPHSANHGAHPRGLSAVDRRQTGAPGKSRPLLRRRLAVDAANPGGFRPLSRVSKTRRRRPSGFIG